MNKRTRPLLIFIIILLIGLFILFLINKKASELSIVAPPELQDHPIYSQYEMKRNDSLINIGIQPLYLPTGIILELMKRDNILNRALSASGKEINYYSFLKGADVNFFLQKELLDGGVGGDMPALSASSSFDVLIPVIIQKGNASIVSVGPMLTNDLKGKRIAYPYGSISHYYILDLLHSSGIPENRVSLIPMEVSAMAKALHNNEIDLFSAWEPTVIEALKQYPEYYITYQKITTGYLYFSKAFVQKNPEIVNHILAAVIRSISWMKSDRENLRLACEWNLKAMEELTGDKSNLNAEEIADVALKDILRYHSKSSIVLNDEELRINSSLHKEYDFLRALSGKTKNSNWEQVAKSFDNDLMKEILSHPQVFHLNDYDYN
jgi:sulfonate transport system substrate-binding protein